MTNKHFKSYTTTFADPDEVDEATEVYLSDRKDHDHEDECNGRCYVTPAIVADCSSLRCAYCGRKK